MAANSAIRNSSPRARERAKLVAACLGLALAACLLAWHAGLFDGRAAGPDPAAGPVVVETPQQQQDREDLEDDIKSAADALEVVTSSS